MINFALPIIEILDKPPQDGSIFKCPLFCKRHFNHKCIEYYNGIKEIPGMHQCPYGFATDVIQLEDSKILITALNIERYSLRRELRKRISKNELYPRIKIVDYYYIKGGINRALVNSNAESYPITKNYINDIFHELRKLNAEIKRQGDYLLRELKIYPKGDRVLDRAQNIFSTSQLFSARLNAFDLDLNPELPFSGLKHKISVYKKFEKAMHCLSLSARNKRINISVNGESHVLIKALEVFDLLPFLILENAIKYSTKNSDVTIEFQENKNTLTVEVTNYGPPVNSEDQVNIFNRGYRGIYGKDFTPEGTGIGLYLAKAIAETHNVELSVFSNSTTINDKGTILAEFIVTLRFHDLIIEKNK